MFTTSAKRECKRNEKKKVTRKYISISITIMVQKTMKMAIYETINHLEAMRTGSVKTLMADGTFGFNASFA